jgi:hypothetical protein
VACLAGAPGERRRAVGSRQEREAGGARPRKTTSPSWEVDWAINNGDPLGLLGRE